MLFIFVGHILNAVMYHLNQVQDYIHSNLDLYSFGWFSLKKLILFLNFRNDLMTLAWVSFFFKQIYQLY